MVLVGISGNQIQLSRIKSKRQRLEIPTELEESKYPGQGYRISMGWSHLQGFEI